MYGKLSIMLLIFIMTSCTVMSQVEMEQLAHLPLTEKWMQRTLYTPGHAPHLAVVSVVSVE